jgi:hypothetical protein
MTSCTTSARTEQIGRFLLTVRPPQLLVRVRPLYLLHRSDLWRLKFFMTLTRGGSPIIQISARMSRTWVPLLGKAVEDSTNLGQWREPYLDPTSSEIRVCQYWMLRSRYPQIEDTSHKRGDLLVHPDPLMSRSALGFRGSCREGGARCAR